MSRREKIIVGFIVLIFFDVFLIREARLMREERVVFCDVGQGDAALISLGSAQAVVDGGPSTAVLSCLGKYMPYFDRKIEYIFVSHPDKDHFLGLVEILRRYSVGQVIINGDESDLPEWQEFKKLAADRIAIASAGDKIKIGQSEIKFLSPEKDRQYKDSNEKSLVFKFTYNAMRIRECMRMPRMDPDKECNPDIFGRSIGILFTGDLPDTIEKKLVLEKIDLVSDILKVGHHGSKTSSSEIFLRAVRPKFATVSVGADNKYGHPNYIILKRLQNLGIKYLRTDEKGDVVINF